MLSILTNVVIGCLTAIAITSFRLENSVLSSTVGNINAFEAVTYWVQLSTIAFVFLAEHQNIVVFTPNMETSQTFGRRRTDEDMAKPNNPLQTVISESADNADSDERYLVRKTRSMGSRKVNVIG